MTVFLKKLGPGLLFAGAAIGVSHLVQSTKAGADYGLGLIWALILVNIFKYPFFQFGPRYALATGESLLSGYKKLGKGILICYIFTLQLQTIQTTKDFLVYHLVARPAFNSDTYKSWFHVSGTPGKHQWLQSWWLTASLFSFSVLYAILYMEG